MDNYDDIINLAPPTSKKHKKMSLHSRAAQFAPFSALTTLEENINETARYTQSRHELTDDEKSILDMNMQIITDNIDCHPLVTIVYFVPDEKKSGGSYRKVTGKLRRIEHTENILIFENDSRIKISDIIIIKIKNLSAYF